jgi:hypothetical protein
LGHLLNILKKKIKDKVNIKKINFYIFNVFVLANVLVIGPIIFCDWARQDCSWSYVSLWLDGNQSDIVLFLNRRWELIFDDVDEDFSLVNMNADLGFFFCRTIKNVSSLVSRGPFI